MRRWLLSTLTLIILLSLLSGIAIYIGRQQPLPERLAMLHLDMCEPPCWIGITPGQTSSEEAKRRIYEVFDQPPYQIIHDYGGRYTIDSKPLDMMFTIQLIIDSGVVETIALNFASVLDIYDRWVPNARHNRVTLADLHIVLGIPRILVMGVPCILHYGVYADSVVMICDSQHRLQLMGSATVLMLHKPRPEFPEKHYLRPWRGFAAFQKYNSPYAG